MVLAKKKLQLPQMPIAANPEQEEEEMSGPVNKEWPFSWTKLSGPQWLTYQNCGHKQQRWTLVVGCDAVDGDDGADSCRSGREHLSLVLMLTSHCLHRRLVHFLQLLTDWLALLGTVAKTKMWNKEETMLLLSAASESNLKTTINSKLTSD